MTARPMTAADFEARYRADPDPWGYRTRPYEHAKYADTLRACGDRAFAHALELGGSIGELTARLAPHCRLLTSIDASPTAVAIARRTLEAIPAPQVEALVGTIPDDLPDGPFDLILASEILYYLAPEAFAATLGALARRAAPGARVVAVHYAPTGPDRPLTAEQVHAALRQEPWLRSVTREDRGDYLLDVLRAIP